MPKTKVKLSPEDKKARQREYNRKHYEANKAKKLQAAKEQYERKKAAHIALQVPSEINYSNRLNKVIDVKLSPETSEVKSSLPPIVPPPSKVVSKPEWENKLFKAATPGPVPESNQVTTQETKKPEPFVPTFKTCSLVKIKESGLVASVQFSKLTLAGEVVNVLVRVPGQAGTKYLQFKADELEAYSEPKLLSAPGQVESIPLVVPVDVASKEPETTQESTIKVTVLGEDITNFAAPDDEISVGYIADADDSEKEYDWLEDEEDYDISELNDSDQVAHQEPTRIGPVESTGVIYVGEKEPETPGYVYLLIAAFFAAMVAGIFLF